MFFYFRDYAYGWKLHAGVSFKELLGYLLGYNFFTLGIPEG